MGKISERMIRSRAEHNEGMVSTLEEVALHQQNIETIELLGQLCPKLKILYLQNNLIAKIQNLHKLKELEYLNVAVNNITKIQNLQRCESLKKLDLTVNFVSKAGLLTVDSLSSNIHLEELYLIGNPCTDWPGYRQYVVAKLPQLKKLDGQDIKPSDRIAAQQAVSELEAQLHAELRAEGVDPDSAALVEDDSLFEEGAEVPETGYVDEKGELRRPWCPATRILEHREMEAQNRAAEEKKKPNLAPGLDAGATPKTYHEAFPEIKEGEVPLQRNEGRWEFWLDESEDTRALVLDVDVGKYLDTSLIQTDLQPKYVRLLIKGKLLVLCLPCEVRPDAAKAQRNTTTGHLVIEMPKEDPNQRVLDVAHLRPKEGGAAPRRAAATPAAPLQQPGARCGGGAGGAVGAYKAAAGLSVVREVRKAAVHAASEDDDEIPDL